MADVQEISSMRLYVQVGGPAFHPYENAKEYHKSITYDLQYALAARHSVRLYKGVKHWHTAFVSILFSIWRYELETFRILQEECRNS